MCVDSDHAGCIRTRRSSSCILAMMGQHVIQTVVLTQGVVALSSGESEFYGHVRAAVEAVFLRNLLKFSDHVVQITIVTDSSAAKGFVEKLGCGRKMKHIAVQNLYLQGLVRQKIINVEKIKGTEHPPDVGTKYLAKPTMQQHLTKLAMVMLTAKGMPVNAERNEKQLVSVLLKKAKNIRSLHED